LNWQGGRGPWAAATLVLLGSPPGESAGAVAGLFRRQDL